MASSAPHLSAALERGSRITHLAGLYLWVEHNATVVRAWFETSGEFMTDRWPRGDDVDHWWVASPPMGRDGFGRGDLGSELEGACADLLNQVRRLDAGERRTDTRIDPIRRQAPARPGLRAALDALRAAHPRPMGVCMRQLPSGECWAWACAYEGAVRTRLQASRRAYVGHASGGDPLRAQEAAMVDLAQQLLSRRPSGLRIIGGL